MKVIKDKTNPPFELKMYDETIFQWGQGQSIFYCLYPTQSNSPFGDHVFKMSLDQQEWEMVDVESIWWGGQRWGLRRPGYKNASLFECTRMFGSESAAREQFIAHCYGEISTCEGRIGYYKHLILEHKKMIEEAASAPQRTEQ